MNAELDNLVPKTKFETEKAEALIRLGFPAGQPILPQLMEWMQDINWPVARVLQPFLASIGAPLEPYIRKVLDTDDEGWKYWVLLELVGESPELFDIFASDLSRMASDPTDRERQEDLDQVAKSVLGKMKGTRHDR